MNKEMFPFIHIFNSQSDEKTIFYYDINKENEMFSIIIDQATADREIRLHDLVYWKTATHKTTDDSVEIYVPSNSILL